MTKEGPVISIPVALRISEPLRNRMVRIKALRSSFMIAGHPAEVGEETVMSYVDASYLVAAGKAEIIGDADPQTIPVSDLKEPKGSGWMAF